MNPTNPDNFDALITRLMPAVLDAARLELSYFAQGIKAERKPDKTPVTRADREAEAILLEALARVAPETPVIAEEAVAAGHIPDFDGQMFFVDALDGTHLFIRGKPEFSVNIGLVENGRPVFGLIYGPCSGQLYVTRSDGHAYRALVPSTVTALESTVRFERLHGRDPDRANLVAFNSRATGGASADFLDALDVREVRPFGSSLKFCRIAAGEGDLYVRLGDTSEWDTAAGQAILEAAGGSVLQLDGQPLTYGHRDRGFKNPHFVAWGRTWLDPAPAAATNAASSG